jgi:demethylmenaquinone methyltransferase / 2-methoxy-6-polyprenyl-1,4-benzoquinol methylase
MTPSQKPSSTDIRGMFDSLAFRYDLFNNLVSCGLDKSWRAKVLRDIPKGARILDVGCGTGDLSLGAARQLAPEGEVVGLDFSSEMLAVARHRYEAMGKPLNGHFTLLQKGAEELPIGGEEFDLVVSGFVLRNLRSVILRALKGMYDSLKAGGEARLLDFTEPASPVMAKIFRGYMNSMGTLYGKILFGEKFPAGYMAESAREFAKPDEFVELLKKTGFESISAERMFFGSVVFYKARKPLV